MHSPTMKDLGIEQLTAEQRIDLALEIWESLGEDHPPSRLTPDQRRELLRRDAELDANPSAAISWERIRKSVEGRRSVTADLN
jgi:putative addiction module component (TIGR02574 family)